MSFDIEPDGDPHGECAAEIKRLNAQNNELYWKLRYNKLCSDIQAIHEQVNEFHVEVETRRVWTLCDFIYVSFNYECTDSEEIAIKNFGEGNYDIYRHWKSFDKEKPT